MRYTVKFRLSDADMEDLKEIAGGASLSEALRRLIIDERKRMKRRKS
jgi:DNA-binding CsgD family transcriptional regulator